MLVHLERQEAATRLLFEHHFSHAAGGLRGEPKVQDKIIAVVAPQSVACQRSNPSETIFEILCGQRAGDWWIMCRHVRLPLLFQPPTADSDQGPNRFHKPERPSSL